MVFSFYHTGILAKCFTKILFTISKVQPIVTNKRVSLWIQKNPHNILNHSSNSLDSPSSQDNQNSLSNNPSNRFHLNNPLLPISQKLIKLLS